MGERVPLSATSWPETCVDIDWVCELLEIKPASLHQLVLRGVFPPSTAPRGRPGSWPLLAVMRFVTEHRRHLLSRLPRLFPRVEPLVPALFLETIVLQASTNPEISDEYLLYLWQPADGGSPIGLAYGVSGHGPRTAAPILAALHRNPATADVGAIAVPRYNAALDRGTLILPEIDYADSSPFRHDLQPTWFDVAYLLQTDLPLWPTHLRDRDAMRSWRSGDPPRPVVPRNPPWGDPTTLLRLADGATEPIPSFCRAWAEEIALRTCPSSGITPDTPLPPGVHPGAYPVSPVSGGALLPRAADHRDVAPVDTETTLRALHSPIPRPEDYSRADTMAEMFHLFAPWIADTIHLRCAPANPLARQWLNRLRPVDGGCSELGYLHVLERARDEFTRDHPLSLFTPVCLVDPLCPDFWIIRSGDLVSLTVPAAIPDATGVLQQLDLTQDWDHHRHPRHGFTAWWTDSTGNAWPLPGPYNYQVGYSGTGPSALARAVTALATDAAARPDDPLTALPEFEAALRVLLVRRDWPTLIRRTPPTGDEPFAWTTG